MTLFTLPEQSNGSAPALPPRTEPTGLTEHRNTSDAAQHLKTRTGDYVSVEPDETVHTIPGNEFTKLRTQWGPWMPL